MTKKIVELSFANRKYEIKDYILDITNAIEHAKCNLLSRFGVKLEGPYVNDAPYCFIYVYIPEGMEFSFGNRLRGISYYLLKQWPEKYKEMLIGKRLLYYTEVTFKEFNTGDCIDCIHYKKYENELYYGLNCPCLTCKRWCKDNWAPKGYTVEKRIQHT